MGSDTVVVDVCIVGGGPTGLFTGLLLSQLGVSVCIIDAKPGPLQQGRADALNARTQQYLEVAGLLDELLPIGLKCNTNSTFVDGKFLSRQNHWWTGLEHCLHKNFLMIGQPELEKAMTRRLQGLVRFGEHFVSITECSNGVEILTESGLKIFSRYAVGADGAKSSVRKQIGALFTGTKPEMLWAVMDTFIDTDFPLKPEIVIFQRNGQSRVSKIPRERGMCRFYVLLEGDVSQALAEKSIKAHMTPYKVDFTKTEWYSTFDVKERTASTFVSRNGTGRIILAGDAAHVHSVNGGQGVNTGLSDAFGLAWRLAVVIRDTSLQPDAANKLIRSYDTERRKTAQDVVDVVARLVRDTVGTAKRYVETIEKNAGYITGMGVTYSYLDSPLVQPSQHGIWKAGNRCPDVTLKTSHGRETRLYSEVSYGQFTLLQIGGEVEARIGFSNVAQWYHIKPASEAEVVPKEEAKIYFGDWVSQDDVLFVVVRPDMYVGIVGQDRNETERYFQDLYIS